MLNRSNFLPTTGNANGVAAGAFINGAALKMARCRPHTLSAQVTVDAETTSLTFSLVWQGSNDATGAFASPVDLANDVNGAPVVLATGTAGADAAVTKAVAAPAAAYGFKYVRCRLLVGGAAGLAADTYSMGYNFRI